MIPNMEERNRFIFGPGSIMEIDTDVYKDVNKPLTRLRSSGNVVYKRHSIIRRTHQRSRKLIEPFVENSLRHMREQFSEKLLQEIRNHNV
jgi:hypothetical protein